MNLYHYYQTLLSDELKALLGEEVPLADIKLTMPDIKEHGDLASNIALILAKRYGQKPRDMAQALAQRLATHKDIEDAQMAGAGFVNLFLPKRFWHDALFEILRQGDDYGSSAIGLGQKINIEYVSANPTGPLHIGHARGAVFGDVLANLFEAIGFEVIREYYVNDEGGQIDILARSLLARIQQEKGEAIKIDDGLYPGDYLITTARMLIKKYGEDMVERQEDELHDFLKKEAVEDMMCLITQELERLNIHHNHLIYESTLHQKNQIDKAMAILKDKGLIYQGVLPNPKGKKSDDWEAKEQVLFRSSLFGDDSDRSVRKSNGDWTYFAGDIAYHYDKCTRGFNRLINIFGADHGGYTKRLKAVVKALSDNQIALDICLMHLVRIIKNGKAVLMSKRDGAFTTLSDLLDEIGADCLRFVMLTRKHDAPLDIDIDLLKKQSQDNPVFYVQYAHARCCSVMRMADFSPDEPIKPKKLDILSHLTDEAEIGLIKRLCLFPNEVEQSAIHLAPHHIAFYLQDVAAHFHALWNKGKENPQLKFIGSDEHGRANIIEARLLLVCATKIILARGLKLMGIKALTEMR